ncbi:4'-phosphopantetheinyl transferase family protein [Streptomyces sp. NPDC088812]|uniref:4'-phosphopantetheinyl transferase family protein n=1 Tax=Streptomyces sp. NPDC088812 TaxID=3365905 RepID=UPI0037F4BC23
MTGTAPPEAAPGRTVDLWWARSDDASARLAALLDPVERGRYEATADPVNAAHFLVGCALTRVVLGELLGLAPAAVPLRRVCPRCGGPHGKVTLATATETETETETATATATAAAPDVRFNVSHSGGVVGLAVCRGADVGLDVEDAATAVDVDKVAPRALTGTELAALRARPPAGRPAAFLRYWTRKESVLKALGVGLRVPLRRLEVTDPALPPAVVSLPEQITTCRELRMADTVVGMTHPASVSVAGPTEVTLVQHRASALLGAWR